MARITVEDCLTKENNRFALVQLAAKRTKQLLQGTKALTTDPRTNKAVVTALREIADGKVRFMTPEEAQLAKEQERLQQSLKAEAAPLEGQNGDRKPIFDDIFKEPSEIAADSERGKAEGGDSEGDDDDEEDATLEKAAETPSEEGDGGDKI